MIDSDATSRHTELSHTELSHTELSHAQHREPVVRPMESTGFALSDAAALADLQTHWDSAYVISLDGDIWSATFRGTADELRAHTALELRTLIRADYAYRQRAGQRPTGGERMSM
ncbi:MAG TPA: hypothetical protein VH520_00060 [Streptosporangiaceae bacterium]